MAWAPDYATTAEAREYITRHTDTVDDTELALALTASSRAVDVACTRGRIARQFGVVAAEQRWYTGRWDQRRARWIVEMDDLMSAVGFAAEVQDSDGSTVGAIDAYAMEPRNAALKGRPWTRLMIRPSSSYQPTGVTDEVALTGPWGWTSVPDTIKQATLLQTNRFFSRRTSPYGVAGSPDIGSELRLLARVDPDVAVMLSAFARWT